MDKKAWLEEPGVDVHVHYGTVIATELRTEGDEQYHYYRVVLRDDQIARIADAVIERLKNMSQVKTDPHSGDA